MCTQSHDIWLQYDLDFIVTILRIAVLNVAGHAMPLQVKVNLQQDDPSERVNRSQSFREASETMRVEEGSSRFPYRLTSSSRPFLAGFHPFPLFSFNAIFPSRIVTATL